jgi:hypothetical protein
VTRVNLTTKFFALIGLVAGLAVLCTVIAAWSSWRLSRLLQDMVDQNLPSLQAAEELEIALLEQRGQVSAYILDAGNRDWLGELGAMKENFDHWLARAHGTARTSDAHAILVELDVAFDKYYARRGDVVALHNEGQRERAIAVLLHEVDPLYREAFQLCEQFIEANVAVHCTTRIGLGG